MYTPVDTLLVHRLGHLAVRGERGPGVPEAWMQALDVEAAALGFVLGYRVRQSIAGLTPSALTTLTTWLLPTLAAFTGAGQPHQPLFRKFPHDVPKDTSELWWKKVCALYLDSADQPCLWCDGIGHTHVLLPCGHVVCDRCFDGSNYSACPVCERPVDIGRRLFFRPHDPPPSPAGPSPVPLRRIELAGDPVDEARGLLQSFVGRAQAMSPTDVGALATIVSAYTLAVLPWLPEKIPVRQNVAIVFARCSGSSPRTRCSRWRRSTSGTVTDLLRVLAVWAGRARRLFRWRVAVRKGDVARWKGDPARIAAEGVAALSPLYADYIVRYPQYREYYLNAWLSTTITSERFKPPKLSRPVRR